ncbi:hypothetical protein HY374_02845 [Candidatus Berkelbacteria bacterium]|nr:hypothetical protein [Candidatus Berkelbacteria bacterium]
MRGTSEAAVGQFLQFESQPGWDHVGRADESPTPAQPIDQSPYHRFREHVLDRPGAAKTRWIRHLEPGESIPEDGWIHEHGRRQAKVVASLIRSEAAQGRVFSAQERADLLTTALYHDVPELLTENGDVHWSIRSDADEATEQQAYLRLIETTVPPELRARFLRALYLSHDPEGKQTELGQFFAMSERVGYLQTAFDTFTAQPIERWEGLTWETCTNIFPLIVDDANRYPSAREFLTRHRATVTEVLRLLQSEAAFRQYAPKNGTRHAWESWEAYRNQFDAIAHQLGEITEPREIYFPLDDLTSEELAA